MDNFSLYEQKIPTNNDLTITFTPDEKTVKYEYIILKDNKEYRTVTVESNNPSHIFLDKTGKYQIKVKAYDIYNEMNVYNSGEYIIDKDKPIISLDKKTIDLPIGSNFSVMEGVSAYDKQEGDLKEFVRTNLDEIDLTTIGTKKLIYTVSDSAGNVVNETLTINVHYTRFDSILALQYIFLGFIILIIFLLSRYRKGLKLEQRLTKYSINPVDDDRISLGDRLVNYYEYIIKKMSAILGKSTVLTKHSMRYQKYINIVNESYNHGLNFISEKILSAVIFVIIAFFAKLIQYELLTFYGSLLPLIFGFFTPNAIYAYKYQMYRNKIENDFLQAITIMNNAFKSGSSITQAIDLVSRELEGPIAREFKKMLMEINCGLSIDTVFRRFSERMKLEEATYLTVTLMILNKTGGNIIKVFSSIEKTLYSRKKLKLEYKALTGSSKIVVSVLILLPLFFVAVVNLINPSYFVPLYVTNIGKIILGLIIAIYVVYIYVIKKFIEIRL